MRALGGLLLGERNGPRGSPPLEPQHAAPAVTLRRDRDRELLDRLRQPLDRHVDPHEVVVRVILRAPLPRVAVEDQLPAVGGGDRPEAVLARRDRRAGDQQVGTGLEHGGRVRSGAPYLVPRHGAAENGTAPHRGPAVAHGEVRTRYARPHRIGGGGRAQPAGPEPPPPRNEDHRPPHAPPPPPHPAGPRRGPPRPPPPPP